MCESRTVLRAVPGGWAVYYGMGPVQDGVVTTAGTPVYLLATFHGPHAQVNAQAYIHHISGEMDQGVCSYGPSPARLDVSGSDLPCDVGNLEGIVE